VSEVLYAAVVLSVADGLSGVLLEDVDALDSMLTMWLSVQPAAGHA
jgi:hypothetical protein